MPDPAPHPLPAVPMPARSDCLPIKHSPVGTPLDISAGDPSPGPARAGRS